MQIRTFLSESPAAARRRPLRQLDAGDIAALQGAHHGDAFAVLGPHAGLAHDGKIDVTVRTFQPGASAVELVVDSAAQDMAEIEPGLFQFTLADGAFADRPMAPGGYTLRVSWPGGVVTESADPYAFAPLLTDYELHLIGEGRHLELARAIGSHERVIAGVEGVMFAVWAPNARCVAVVGDFNAWDARRHPMRRRIEAGIWELFIPGLRAGEIYKYAIVGPDGRHMPWKADPMTRQAELPPRTGSVVAPPSAFVWTDEAWLAGRANRHRTDAPISIYEAHVESWLRTADGQPTTWEAAAERLIAYAGDLGFTHLELMPIAEYPFGGSWGYQPLSLYAPTGRLGSPADFARFVDRCHAAGLGVIVDWVPAHFPSDEHGLARFDGTALFEHDDPREGFHHDWNTLIYNAGRSEVKGFLLASALWWLETFHVDGLRVDAVASMLYRDYSRPADAWIPNRHGGRENLESISFLKELNATILARCPGVVIIAEESTAWPAVTSRDGLGFDYKWNMGWMHDTLRFFARDPVHRGHHFDDIAFGLDYGFSEAYVLPLSHDEVVHGKGSLLGRMPGDDWQRFANLRLLLALMWTHPGKKLLFMGGEFGADAEWNADAPFPWPHHDDRLRQGMPRLVADLNRAYREQRPLHLLDRDRSGFAFVVQDTGNGVLAFRRSDGDMRNDILVVLNLTPVPRFGYGIGVPAAGHWTEILNSDAVAYGGSGMGNFGGATTQAVAMSGQPQSLWLTLPPLGALILKPPPLS